MKDALLQLVAQQDSVAAKRNAAREYLQAYILRMIHESKLFSCLSFMGGTALRFLYDLPRFSEDLDFSLDEPEEDVLQKILDRAEKELPQAGYDISISFSGKRAVHGAFIRFQGLPFELGFSGQASEKFAIKLKIDTNPPKGAIPETTVIHRHFPLAIRHHNIASLFSGKLMAVLSRTYTKGRDYYDLLWYLTRWKKLSPNLEYMNAGLQQSGWEGKPVTGDGWKGLLVEKFQKVSWEKIQTDVRPFLERPDDAQLLTMENIVKLLENA